MRREGVQPVDEDRENDHHLPGIDRRLAEDGEEIIEEEEMISREDDNRQGTFHRREDSAMIDDIREVEVLPEDTVLRLPHEDIPSHPKLPS